MESRKVDSLPTPLWITMGLGSLWEYSFVARSLWFFRATEEQCTYHKLQLLHGRVSDFSRKMAYEIRKKPIWRTRHLHGLFDSRYGRGFGEPRQCVTGESQNLEVYIRSNLSALCKAVPYPKPVLKEPLWKSLFSISHWENMIYFSKIFTAAPRNIFCRKHKNNILFLRIPNSKRYLRPITSQGCRTVIWGGQTIH